MTLLVVMECLFSATFLADLCNRGERPSAVIVAHHVPVPFAPVFPRQNLLRTTLRVDDCCHQYGIPLYRVYQWDVIPDTFLRQFSLLVVACYPRLLPAARLSSLGIAAWNVHPSALPQLRGPDPLFYSARGDAPPAVTIHHIDETYDTGPVLCMASVAEPTVCDERTYVQTHARAAAELVHSIKWNPPDAKPQHSDPIAPWATIPSAKDYILDPTWSMARVRRFVALTDQRKHPYWVSAAQSWVRVVAERGDIPIPCADGVLWGMQSPVNGKRQV